MKSKDKIILDKILNYIQEIQELEEQILKISKHN